MSRSIVRLSKEEEEVKTTTSKRQSVAEWKSANFIAASNAAHTQSFT